MLVEVAQQPKLGWGHFNGLLVPPKTHLRFIVMQPSGRNYRRVAVDVAMQSTLHTVSDEVSAARIDFMATVYDVPEINGLHRNALDMLSTLCGQSGGIRRGECHRERRTRSSVAAHERVGGAAGAGGVTLYLPVVTR